MVFTREVTVVTLHHQMIMTNLEVFDMLVEYFPLPLVVFTRGAHSQEAGIVSQHLNHFMPPSIRITQHVHSFRV
jgi:hypothetical protein